MLDAKLAAVLIPFHYSPDGQLHVSLIRRTPGGAHGGQLAFPGGKYESGDVDLLDTALRETEEEIGLFRKDIKIIRSIEPIQTYTGFIIHPYVGLLQNVPDRWVIEPAEVQEVLTVSVAEIAANPDTHAVHLKERKEIDYFPCYLVSGYPLWGASYRMIDPIIQAYTAGELDF